jgi:hypothetical protein
MGPNTLFAPRSISSHASFQAQINGDEKGKERETLASVMMIFHVQANS